MVFYNIGSNTNVTLGSTVYHVQTQVLADQQLIVTVVMQGGLVVYDDKVPYSSFIEGIEEPSLIADILKDSANEQHNEITKGLEGLLEIRRKEKEKERIGKEKEAISAFLGSWAKED